MPRRLNTKVPSPDPLPRWLDLPLNSKLPMLRTPKGALVLYTTKLSQKLRKNYPELDFDLNDPHSYGFDNTYKPLHDVYLRDFLRSPDMKKRLQQQGFITRNDEVLCSLKEFNDYRAYLRSINLDLRKRQLTLQREKLQRELRRKRQRETAAMLRRREEHIQEVQQRLSKQKQEDRIKFMAMEAEREQWSKEQRVANTEAEREANRKYQKKQELRRKMSTLRRWLQDDLERTRRIEERKMALEEERRLKLEDEWERRKLMQAELLDVEREKREADEEDKTRRIERRQEMLDKQRQEQQETLVDMIGQRRNNKARKEADYQRRLKSKIINKHKKSKRHMEKDSDEDAPPPKSYWNIENSLEHLIIAGPKPEGGDEKGDAEKKKKAPKSAGKAKEEREQRDPNLLFVSDRRDTPYHADGVPTRPSQMLAAKMEEMGIMEGSEEALEGAESKEGVAGSELDECRCSLIKLQRVAKEMENFDDEAKALASNLHEIMSDLKLGRLQPNQVQKLTDFATDVLRPHLQADHICICGSPTPTPIAESSNFAKNIISQVINSVQDSLLPITDAKKKPSDLSPFTKSLAKRAIATTTSKILGETDALMEKPLNEEAPSLRKSYTSDLVKVVLQKSAAKILRDMRGSVNSNAELKAYIDDIIQQCMQELVQEYLDEKAPKPSAADKKKPNYVSVASMLVRDTITDVIKELCEQSKIPSPFGGILPGTASSVFVESLILETIRECLQELKDKEVTPEKLVEYATDILASHTALKKQESKEEKSDDKLTMECGYQKASSTLLDGLIFHLVTAALRAIEDDEINSKQMKKLEGVIKPSKSSTDTASRVTKALLSVLEDIGGSKPPVQVLLHWDTKVPLQDIVFSTQAKSLESLHAETAVLQALHDGQKKVYAPQESPPESRRPSKERKLSAAAERCVSMVLGRAVHEYFSDKQKDGKDKPPPANVDELVDYSVGLVIMQLANESQGGEAKIPYPTLATKAKETSPTRSKSPPSKGAPSKKGKAKSAKKKKGKKGPPNFATKPPKKKKRTISTKAEASPPPRPKTPPPQNKPKSEAKVMPPKIESPKESDEEEEQEISGSKMSATVTTKSGSSFKDSKSKSSASAPTKASDAASRVSSAGSAKSKASGSAASKASGSATSKSSGSASSKSSGSATSKSSGSASKSSATSRGSSAGSTSKSSGSSSRSQSAASATPKESQQSAATAAAKESQQSAVSAAPKESDEAAQEDAAQDSVPQLSRRSSYRSGMGGSKPSIGSGNNTANSSSTSNRRRSSGSNAHMGHTVLEGKEYVHSDESDECSLEPMVDNQTLNSVDPTVVENNLSVISVKRSHDLQHFTPNQAVARNSFRNLVSPNVHKVRRFSNENEDEIASHIESLIEKHESATKSQSQTQENDKNSSAESSAEEDDAPAPGEQEDLVSVTEIHTAEELEKLRQLSKEKAEQLSKKSNTSVHSSGSKGSQRSASGKSSSRSIKSSGDKNADAEDQQGSRVASASASDKHADAEDQQGSRVASASASDKNADAEDQQGSRVLSASPSDKNADAEDQQGSRVASASASDKNADAEDQQGSRVPSASASDKNADAEDQQGSRVASASASDKNADAEDQQGSRVASASDRSVAKSHSSVGKAQSKSENASNESLSRRADIPTSDTDQAIKAQESRAVKSANSVDRESGKGSDTEEKKSEAEEDNTETPKAVSETKSDVPDENDTSEAKSITDPTQQEESEAVKENGSEEEQSVQLTPKASIKDLPPTDAGSGSGTAGNDSPAGSANLSQKSSMSSLDGKSRARLSHAHNEGPKTTSSEMAADDMQVEKPHSPVGSMPDMQASDGDEAKD